MKRMGLKSFRFSICWARILTDVDGEINKEGIDYYNNVIDCLLENDIIPFFDLYHCDMPMFVVEKGGPKNAEFVKWFTRYAEICFTHFGDRVKFWSTVNEPVLNVFGAYARETNGPFEKDLKGGLLASHHMLLAHYKTIKLYREMKLGGKIGAVNHFIPTYAKSLDPRDIHAADLWREFYSGWWLDPMLKGKYPEIVTAVPYVAEKMPENYAKELADAFEEMDFVGINYYNPAHIEYVEDGEMNYNRYENPLLPKDDYGFACYPPGLFDVLMYVKETYGNSPIYITENGIGKKPQEDPQKDLDDQYRIDHMREHLRQANRAIAAGVNLRGYYCWTFLDTYEGNSGAYLYKFGLVRVDPSDLTRTPRRSFDYYKNIIANNMVD